MNYLLYAVPLLVGFVMSLYAIKRMRLESYNKKNLWRTVDEDEKTPVQVGGVSIFPLLLITLCASLALPQLMEQQESSDIAVAAVWRILQVMLGCSILYLVGLKDDLHGTDGKFRFLALLAVSNLFPVSGLWIDNLQGLLGLYEIPAWLGMPLTVLVAMYVTELFKLMDGIDGLASGVTAMCMGLFLGIAVWQDFAIAGILAASTLGVTGAFWLLKTVVPEWRRTVMGSAGCYVMGYLICYMVLGLSRQTSGPLGGGLLMVLVAIVLMPALDIMRVVLSRARDSRGLLVADMNQIHHKLTRTGMKRWSVMCSMLGMTMCQVALAVGLVLVGCNLTVLLVAMLVMYVGFQLLINYFIHKHENKEYHRVWVKTYGQQAWESNVPEETLRKKQETFGTMGLPAYVVGESQVEFIPDGMNAFERNTKRLVDMTIAGVSLIVFSPLFLLSYILIKLDDGGPAIYRQERIGRFGRPFYILKYRSMRLDAEKFGPAQSHAGGDDDPRLTKVGKFLRAHHLDELPQLWNVFKGEMAFIGYRPERKFFIDQIMEHDPRYAFLYQIRPGVTSYATLYNGYTDTMEKMLRRLELDLYYLGHRSWWLDFKVLFLTFTSIVGGKKF